MINTAFLPPLSKKPIILIRHANRNRINDDESLNEAGITSSIEFGKKLMQYDSLKIFAGFTDRCLQTSNCILQGFNKTGSVSQSILLGKLGPFIVDAVLMEETIRKLNPYITVENQMARIDMPGFRSLDEGGALLKKFIEEKMNAVTEGDLLIFITHGMIAVPFIHLYTSEKFSEENWLEFLDGVIIFKNEGHLRMMRNGKEWEM